MRSGRDYGEAPVRAFPSVMGKVPNREEGDFIFFMPGFLEFPLHGNVSRIWTSRRVGKVRFWH